MDNELSINGQKVRFDREATVAIYRDTIKAGADLCTCIYCKNFAAQRNQVYPQEFLKLLNRLGADPNKELEAFDYGTSPETPKLRLYGGWFVFSGELAAAGAKRPEQPPFAYWFTTSFPAVRLSRDVNTCAVEFLAEVPWVLPGIPEW